MTHLVFRVEYIDMDTVDTKKTVGNGRAGVTTCCHENVDLLLAFASNEILKQAGHEASSNVFKSQRGAMEEFKRIDIIFYVNGGNIKRQRFIDDVSQSLNLNVATKEGLGYFESYLLKT